MKSATSRPRRSVAPLLRVTAVLTVAVVVGWWLAAHRVRAQVDDAMFGLGSRVMRYPGMPFAEPRSVRVNGVHVFVRSEVVESSVSEVLEHYRGICVQQSARSSRHSVRFGDLATRLSIRERDGYVACLDIGSANLETLARRLARFSDTWDLSHVGAVRYAYARRASDPPEERALVVTIWTDSSLDLRRMLPLEGRDADGEDLADFIRPEGSQRILSAREGSEPTGVFVYLVPRALPETLEAEHRRALEHNGWVIVQPSRSASGELEGGRVVSAQKGGKLVTALFHRRPGDPTVVTFLASGID